MFLFWALKGLAPPAAPFVRTFLGIGFLSAALIDVMATYLPSDYTLGLRLELMGEPEDPLNWRSG